MTTAYYRFLAFGGLSFATSRLKEERTVILLHYLFTVPPFVMSFSRV